jgi:polyisoprenoid-binding protein YceI
MKNHINIRVLIFVVALLFIAGVRASALPPENSGKPAKTDVTAPANPETFKIDPVHTTAFFKVGHLGIGFVRGGFTDISGTVTVDKKKASGNSVEVTINTASIFTSNSMRDDDLKTNFFEVAKYPTMSFKSKKFVHLRGKQYRVTGDFTLHGVTKTITVNAQMLGEGKGMQSEYRGAFESLFTIKRSEYGMMKDIPAAGDNVEISLIVEGIRE